MRPCLRRALPCALLLACAALLPGAAGTLSASPAGPADRTASERPADAASLAESGSADRREAALQQGLAAFPAPVDEARASDPGGAGIHSARERETFWAWDFHHRHDYSVPARLRHASPVLWVYEEEGAEVPSASIARIARLFEEQIQPELRQRFGTEPSPGIDGEQAITLLLLDIRDDTAYARPPYRYVSGYFDPANQVSQLTHDQRGTGRRSNAREMLFLDVRPTLPDGEVILQTLAHEYAHLITWNYDPTETTWLAESIGQLAVHVAGLGHPRAQLEAYLEAPEGSLTDWAGTPRDYGRAYAFGLYLFEQLGGNAKDAGRMIVQDPASGMSSLAGLLPPGRDLGELLRDFGLALQVDLPTASAPRLGFRALELGKGDLPYALARKHDEARLPDGRLEEELPAWSLRFDRFVLGDESLEIGMEGSDAVCYGAGRASLSSEQLVRIEGDAVFDLSCRAVPGAPWILRAPPADERGSEIVTVVANGSARPLGLRMLATRARSASAPESRLYLPIALGGHRAR